MRHSVQVLTPFRLPTGELVFVSETDGDSSAMSLLFGNCGEDLLGFTLAFTSILSSLWFLAV